MKRIDIWCFQSHCRGYFPESLFCQTRRRSSHTYLQDALNTKCAVSALKTWSWYMYYIRARETIRLQLLCDKRRHALTHSYIHYWHSETSDLFLCVESCIWCLELGQSIVHNTQVEHTLPRRAVLTESHQERKRDAGRETEGRKERRGRAVSLNANRFRSDRSRSWIRSICVANPFDGFVMRYLVRSSGMFLFLRSAWLHFAKTGE